MGVSSHQAMANAWIRADMAATERKVTDEKLALEEKYGSLYNSLIDEQIKAQEDKAKMGQDLGIGLSLASIFMTGGMSIPQVATTMSTAYQIGEGIGEVAYEQEFGKEDRKELQRMRKDLKDFDWELSAQHKKWNALRQTEWESGMEDISEKHAQDYETWEKGFYRGLGEGLIEEMLPVALDYATSQVMGAGTEKGFHDFDFDFKPWKTWV
tara:strand:+ start:601 stop:1233 length:633 start_codon:yes stop_codon:yes gene_type:complete